MESEILMCDYSHHIQPFYTYASNGLPGYLIRLQTEGYASVLIDGKMQPIGPGHLLILHPGDPYQLAIEAYEHPQRGLIVSSSDYYLACQGKWLDKWREQRKHPPLVRVDVEEKLLSLWRLLILEKRRMEKENEELSEYLLRSLCLSIDRLIDDQSIHRGRPFVASRIKSYIEEHATSSFKIEDLANHVGLSVSRASHLFKECYGKTIIEYMQEIRLAIAEERMKYSSMTLEQIAETCGFASYSYFFRVFRKKFNMSPVDYRVKHAPALASIARQRNKK
ncbi:AraC family transcriptional regulator [Paenibacillus abyssi]|uniref:HTH araC/xylS-type domain-containing protein n=1 Tax=Paenibacillus abyssi TaxID=1340531 RepID=A0A917FJR9_9BACL|nr:AraC family transcriptional regulator [Paenibacillus abyssi]GGF86776.1 hypothetical protein GCM10010916_00120 [Paenibacillus abyssi]